ncbi:MAG: cystathionine gamma-synthase family protein [SAR324 cluster bacterium]|nr:cystathionine gamma-synthase family protein [SAR324 cluster bacterium]
MIGSKKDEKKADIRKNMSPESLMMSYGYKPELSEGALKCPIFQTSTFVFKTAEEGKHFFEIAYGLKEMKPLEEVGLIYTRLNNPDLEILENRLTLWDKAEEGAVFSSGMAAIFTVAYTFLRPGDAVLFFEPSYGGTEYLFHNVLPQFGIESVCLKAGSNREETEATIENSGFKDKLTLIFLETPANPTNKLTDISMLAEVAEKYSSDSRKVVLAVDNTFLGPFWQKPIEHGADLVVYSATKFIGGHSDVVAGVCLGSKQLLKPLKAMRTFMGNMATPWTGWLLMRSLETLQIRMTRQAENARYVADYLLGHPMVQKVYYLGHIKEEDPQFQIFCKQCNSGGAMIAFDISGNEKIAFHFLNSLQLIKLAVSLGGTESLAEHPASMTHSDVPPEDQKMMGVSERMIRLSIGIENKDDLISDLENAFRAYGSVAGQK